MTEAAQHYQAMAAEAEKLATHESLVKALTGFVVAHEYGITPDAGQMEFARAALAKAGAA